MQHIVVATNQMNCSLSKSKYFLPAPKKLGAALAKNWDNHMALELLCKFLGFFIPLSSPFFKYSLPVCLLIGLAGRQTGSLRY